MITHATLPGVMTCPAGHNHGNAIVRLTWDPALPVALDVELDYDQLGQFGIAGTLVLPAERDEVAKCAAFGDVDFKIYGVVGQGITFKVRKTEPQTLIICWPYELPSRVRVGIMCAVDRADLGDFISRTYDVIAAGREDLDLDRVAAHLLYS